MSPEGESRAIPSLLFKRAGSDVPKQRLRAFASTLSADVAGARAFTCLFTDDRELQRLNRMFLGHDYPTDVLTFPSPGEDGAGDIAVSMDRAREQAKRFGHSLEDELKILMLHGVLHLTGMDHEKDRGAMARAEKRLRKQFGLTAGLIERARR